MTLYAMRIKQEREQRNWSQAEVARRLGTSPANVRRWEHGLSFPGPYYRRKLCVLYEQTLEALGLVPGMAEDTHREQAEQKKSSQEKPSVWCVPYQRNAFFVGREDILARLYTTFHTSSARAMLQTVALTGMGGIGKTQTALEYAYRHADAYQTVLWVRAETYSDLVSDYVTLAHALDLREKDETDQQRVIAAVLCWLEQHSNWLLILDNVEDFSLLTTVIPKRGRGHILLTTRDQAPGAFALRVDLPAMQPEEGVRFLLRGCRRIIDEGTEAEIPATDYEPARQLSQLLYGLPLALDQAGAYIEETGCSLLDYQQRLERDIASLLSRRGNRPQEQHLDSLYTTIALSFEKVEQTDPVAADVLRLCAFLSPEGIPEALFTHVRLPGDQAEVLNPFRLDMAIAVLRTYSLIVRHPQTKTLAVHRLVQAILREAMSEDEQRKWLRPALEAVNEAFPSAILTQQTQEQWRWSGQLLPHALSCLQWSIRWEDSLPGTSSLLMKTANYLRDRGRYEEAEPLYHRAVQLCEEQLGADHPTTAMNLNHLGLLYEYQGKYAEAESLYRRALIICEEQLGPSHPDTGQCLNTLAALFHIQGKYAEAEPLYRRTLAICEEQLGPEHPDTAQCLNNLAVLCGQQGRYAEAEGWFVRILSLRERILGADHPSVAASCNNLASLYRKQRAYQKAEPLYRRALTICEEQLGMYHPHTAICVYNLALLLSEQGISEGVEDLYQRALTIRRQALGETHPDTLNSLMSLADFYMSRGNCAEARTLYMHIVEHAEGTLGKEHPLTQRAKCQMSRLEVEVENE